MIQVKNITKTFGSLEVLKGINVHIREKEVVTIEGASGAGKSTLLQIMGTLLRPDSGSVHINGSEIQTLKEQSLAAFRNRQIGFVFQFHHLLPEFTALENICIPAFIGGAARKSARNNFV